MRLMTLLTAGLLFTAFALGGMTPLGRVLLALEQPRLAAKVFRSQAWRGVAHFRAGAYDVAARNFSDAGQYFNLGNAEAFAGNYAAALEAYDMAIARGDTRAKANFDVVAAHYAGMAIAPETLALFPKRKEGASAEAQAGEGSARAAGTGDGVTNTNTMLGQTELLSRGKLGVRRVFDDQFMVADDRWLLQLEDVPGAFMAERILQEHKRRSKLGLSPPLPEDPQ